MVVWLSVQDEKKSETVSIAAKIKYFSSSIGNGF
jgi:hypothetical protein